MPIFCDIHGDFPFSYCPVCASSTRTVAPSAGHRGYQQLPPPPPPQPTPVNYNTSSLTGFQGCYYGSNPPQHFPVVQSNVHSNVHPSFGYNTAGAYHAKAGTFSHQQTSVSRGYVHGLLSASAQYCQQGQPPAPSHFPVQSPSSMFSSSNALPRQVPPQVPSHHFSYPPSYHGSPSGHFGVTQTSPMLHLPPNNSPSATSCQTQLQHLQVNADQSVASQPAIDLAHPVDEPADVRHADQPPATHDATSIDDPQDQQSRRSHGSKNRKYEHKRSRRRDGNQHLPNAKSRGDDTPKHANTHKAPIKHIEGQWCLVCHGPGHFDAYCPYAQQSKEVRCILSRGALRHLPELSDQELADLSVLNETPQKPMVLLKHVAKITKTVIGQFVSFASKRDKAIQNTLEIIDDNQMVPAELFHSLRMKYSVFNLASYNMIRGIAVLVRHLRQEDIFPEVLRFAKFKQEPLSDQENKWPEMNKFLAKYDESEHPHVSNLAVSNFLRGYRELIHEYQRKTSKNHSDLYDFIQETDSIMNNSFLLRFSLFVSIMQPDVLPATDENIHQHGPYLISFPEERIEEFNEAVSSYNPEDPQDEQDETQAQAREE